MPKTAVAVAIVNFRTASLITGCLESLYAQNVPLRVTVVDNSASHEEDALTALADRFPVQLISSGENLGYGGGCNEVLRHAKEDYLLCMNPDVRLHPHALAALIAALKERGGGIAGPRFFWDDERRFYLPPSLPVTWSTDSAAFWSSRVGAVRRLWSRAWRNHELQTWTAVAPLSQQMISGACILAHRTALRPDGLLFDPGYFMYYEDTDLCRRVRGEGQPVLYVPQAEATHLYDQSPAEHGFKSAEMARGAEAYRRGYPPWQAMLLRMQYRLGAARGESLVSPEGVVDLGEPGMPPTFSWSGNEPCWVRVGINPAFVPSAGARAEGGRLSFPKEIWDRLSPGTYYTEVRRDRDDSRLGFWSWRRPSAQTAG